MHGNVQKGNICFSRISSQLTALYVSQDPTITAFFNTLDSNYYARPIDDNSTIITAISGASTNRTLASWQTYVSPFDSHSNKSPMTITDVNDLVFEYNPTKFPLTRPLS